MLKRFTPVVFLSALLLLFGGCQNGTQQPSAEPLQKYFEAILAQDYSAAYNQLCRADQAVITEEDYVLWQDLYRQTDEFKTYTLGSGKELNGFKDPFGNRYPRAVEFTITQTDYAHADQRENTYDYTRTVVLEDGVWKISRGETADIYQHRIYYGFSTLGTMYAEGRGVEKDPQKALEYLTRALDYNANDVNLYFRTALLNLNSQQPAAAEALCRRALTVDPDGDMTSELHNLLGVALIMQEKDADARLAFEAAIKADPANENAQNNLNNLNR